MRVWRGVSFLLMCFLFVSGIFALLIVSHEGYHYFAINGHATGVCFGDCNLVNGSAVGAVYWNNLQNFNGPREERNAWIFAFIFSFGFLGLLAYSRMKD